MGKMTRKANRTRPIKTRSQALEDLLRERSRSADYQMRIHHLEMDIKRMVEDVTESDRVRPSAKLAVYLLSELVAPGAKITKGAVKAIYEELAGAVGCEEMAKP